MNYHFDINNHQKKISNFNVQAFRSFCAGLNGISVLKSEYKGINQNIKKLTLIALTANFVMAAIFAFETGGLFSYMEESCKNNRKKYWW